MKSALSDAIQFLLHNDIKTILARIRERNVPALIQFGVYGMCGGLATVFFLGTIIALAKTVIPAYEGMQVASEPVRIFGYEAVWPSSADAAHAIVISHDKDGDKIRAANLLVNNFAGFLIANIVAYVTNILFVFKGGRHHPALEFLYFTLINLISFALSQIAGPKLVAWFGIPTNVAILTNLVTSMLLNFVCRKFFVFKS